MHCFPPRQRLAILGMHPASVPMIFCQFAIVFGAFLVSTISPVAAQTVLKDGWKVQSSAQVSAPASHVSEPGFSTHGWYPTSGPKTGFAALVENGGYQNPYFAMNLRSFPGVAYKIGGQFANEEMPADSPYSVPWWYRNEFEVPAADKGKQVWMQFLGINGTDEICINGKKVTGSDYVVCYFRRSDFNVTDFIHPGAKNAVAISVSAPK